MDRRVPFVADLPRGSHGRQPRAANSVSSIHFALLLLPTLLCSAISHSLLAVQAPVLRAITPAHRVLWEESKGWWIARKREVLWTQSHPSTLFLERGTGKVGRNPNQRIFSSLSCLHRAQ